MNNIDLTKLGFRKDYKESTRLVAQEWIWHHFKRYFVSTVDLGLDHSHGYGKPLYYETMIFPGLLSDEVYCKRYTTRDDALQGHKDIIKSIKNKKIILNNGYFVEKEDTNE